MPPPSDANGGMQDALRTEISLTTLRACADDATRARTELHHVFQWTFLALAAVLGGGFALLTEPAFNAPADRGHTLIVLTVFVLGVPCLAALSSVVLLLHIARLLQARLLTEAYEILLHTDLAGSRHEPLVLREFVYRRWDALSEPSPKPPTGSDVTRNGHAASVLIYCTIIAGSICVGLTVLLDAPYLRGDLALKVSVAVLGVLALGAAAGLIIWQGVAVRDLLRRSPRPRALESVADDLRAHDGGQLAPESTVEEHP